MLVSHRAVFFDFGGTLFSYGALRERFDGLLQEVASQHGIEAPPEELRLAYRTTMAEAFLEYRDRPFYLHRELFESAQRGFVRRLGGQARPVDERFLYDRQSELGLARVSPRPDARETLLSLRKRGLHLGIVSNIDDDQFHPLWQRLGLESLFHATTTSEEARSCKPDPGIFRVALEKAGNPAPEEVVFVGDSALHDVAGAGALGMKTVLIGREPQDEELRPDHVIASLCELSELVES